MLLQTVGLADAVNNNAVKIIREECAYCRLRDGSSELSFHFVSAGQTVPVQL